MLPDLKLGSRLEEFSYLAISYNINQKVVSYESDSLVLIGNGEVDESTHYNPHLIGNIARRCVVIATASYSFIQCLTYLHSVFG